MGNSTTRLQDIVDFAKTHPELNPVLSTGGFSQQPALTIANDVMIAMLAEPFAWKWNRRKIPFFYTNSFQQDYSLVGVNDMAWLEYAIMMDINSTSEPKNKFPLEVVRDLPETAVQYGRPGQISWFPNDMLIYGTWGGGNQGEGNLINPGAGSVYLPRLNNGTATILGQPSNPITQLQDALGYLWVLTNSPTVTTTLGSLNPFVAANPTYVGANGQAITATNPPTFPSYTNPNTLPTVVTGAYSGGTDTWTAVNPKGQGLRMNPIPPQTGTVWQCRTFYQMRPVQFTALSQTLEPIPDDFVAYFRRGFVAYSFMHSKDPKVQAKFQTQHKLWTDSLTTALRSVDRERDNTGIYPSDAIMQAPGSAYIGPANPYYPGGQ